MKERTIRLGLQQFLLAFCLLADVAVLAQAAASPTTTAPSVRAGNVAEQASGGSAPSVCARCIRAHMEFLASDALRGRGSGTPDELLAATYVAAQLEQYGVAPAGDHGTYIQQAPVIRQKLSAPPTLWFMTPGDGIPAQRIQWTHGKEMLVLSLSDSEFKGRLKSIDTDRDGASLEQMSFSDGARSY